MKCLRCGKELKNGQMECSCGHFYESNLKGNRTINRKNKSKRKMTLIEILAIIVILIILLIIGMSAIIQNNNINNNEECEIKCEGYPYTVRNNKCICSYGEE